MYFISGDALIPSAAVTTSLYTQVKTRLRQHLPRDVAQRYFSCSCVIFFLRHTFSACRASVCRPEDARSASPSMSSSSLTCREVSSLIITDCVLSLPTPRPRSASMRSCSADNQEARVWRIRGVGRLVVRAMRFNPRSPLVACRCLKPVTVYLFSIKAPFLDSKDSLVLIP